jgi:addiction module HigA family antidote
MKILDFTHKGLKRLYTEATAKGVPPDTVDKLRKMFAYLDNMKNPPHPGDFIRTEIIEPAGLSVTAAAIALQVSRPALSSLLNGKADLSGDMALRIEKAFGVKMDTLMRMQASYDIAQTRKREREIRVRRFCPPAEVHP